MVGKSSGRSFLTGLVLGGVVGSAITIWLVMRMQRGRRGAQLGGRVGEIASIVRERGGEFLGKVREIVSEAVEEGRGSARKTRSDVEERFKEEREE